MVSDLSSGVQVEVTWGLSGEKVTLPWNSGMVAAEVSETLAKMQGLTGDHGVLLVDIGSGAKLRCQEQVPANSTLQAVVIDHCMRRQKIAVGEFHALLISDGELKVSAAGGISLSSTSFNDFPDSQGRHVVSVAAADLTSLLLLDNGDVLVRCGDGNPQLPNRMGSRAIAIAAAPNHAVILLEDGHVQIAQICRSCGSHYTDCGCQAKVMIPDLQGRCAAGVAAGTRHFLVIMEDGDVLAFDLNSSQDGLTRQANVPHLCGERAVAAAGGDDHSLLLLSNGKVLAWGRNDCGQIDIPDLDGRQAISIAAASRHSMVLLNDGSVLAFGDLGHFCGDLSEFCKAIELSGERAVAIAAGDYCALALLANGDFVAIGEMDHPQNGESTIELHFRRPSQSRVASQDTDIIYLGWGGQVASKCTIREANAEAKKRLSWMWRDNGDDNDDTDGELGTRDAILWIRPGFDSKENCQWKRWRDAKRRNQNQKKWNHPLQREVENPVSGWNGQRHSRRSKWNHRNEQNGNSSRWRVKCQRQDCESNVRIHRKTSLLQYAA
eukprot:gnl/MRDRNA2_/MRDRNA2_103180_c0_seq1.p1 gnl/MRDRNA2_/MRDRNA2_103180_c0~~gnl/MRDRNA2_/MRDRNA2_103180_c0_seq1.p1  ORF type:complete len:581 (-),score=102.74 gnl/MRDRNA2_/MRDRNA2_103180_c0_seq1:40-1689(-)